MSERGHFKDEGLNRLASEGHNIAQFTSFDAQGTHRFSRLIGCAPNHQFASNEEAIGYMLANTAEHQVNVRSFDPQTPESRPFTMRHTSSDEVMNVLHARQSEGLHTIVNETVSTDDGGVSGVVLGDIVEVVPDDTPRGVEGGDTAQFTRAMGARIIEAIYHFAPNFGDNLHERREFTVTPLRRGIHNDHTIIWEVRDMESIQATADTWWPNKLSRMLGDKTFGLLMADQLGLCVPATTVFNRRVAPFTFGQPTGTAEYWMRTAPFEQTPGLFTTTRGWIDPYRILQNEDSEGDKIASVLAQEGVDAKFSGACIMGADGNLIINGRCGYGDDFMVGESGTMVIPPEIQVLVEQNYYQALQAVGGPVRFEWVFDGRDIWTVQLHRGESTSYGNVIYPGDENTTYIDFPTHDANGHSRIAELREFIAAYVPGTGIKLVGNVGITSHLGDLLRKAKIPSQLVQP